MQIGFDGNGKCDRYLTITVGFRAENVKTRLRNVVKP